MKYENEMLQDSDKSNEKSQDVSEPRISELITEKPEMTFGGEVIEDASESVNKKRKSARLNAIQWVATILVAFLCALLLRGYVFEFVKVSGISMKNTLQDGESLFVNKASYYFSGPKRGDVVILYISGSGDNSFVSRIVPDFQETDYVKRIVGLSGEVIDIKEGKVFINGQPLKEDYAVGTTVPLDFLFPATIPADKYFVLGDNRNDSRDSRIIGFIDKNAIKGQAQLILWPFNNIKGLGSSY